MHRAISPSFNAWKYEIDLEHEILSFCCIAPKTYAVLYKNKETGRVYKLIKAKGFYLEGEIAKNALNEHVLDELLHEMISGQKTKRYITQFSIRIDKASKRLYSEVYQKKLQNLYNKRVLNKGSKFANDPKQPFQTFPYGYIPQQYQNLPYL